MNGESSYRRFLSGDNTALGDLVEKYNKSLVFYLNGILKSISLAEDIAADTFVEILVKKPRLKTEEAFRAYLFRAARNNAIDELRKRQRRGVESGLEEGDVADTLCLEQQFLRDEASRALHKALGELNADYRDTLHLLYFQQMSYESAAKAMKKSVKQITNLAYQGKKALRKLLEKEGISYED